VVVEVYTPQAPGNRHTVRSGSVHVARSFSLWQWCWVQGMPGLVVVQLDRCQGLRKAELGSLSALQQLHIVACDQLQEVAGLGQLAALTQLKVQRCGQLQSAETLTTTLQHLAIHTCGKLAVAGLEKLAALTELRLTQYQPLWQVRCFTALQQLTLWGCHEVQEVDLRGCTALKHVSLRHCHELRELSGLEQLGMVAAGAGQQQVVGTSLPTLDIQGCYLLPERFLALEGDQVRVWGPAPSREVREPRGH
jgi:hypothetical protein